MDQLTRRSTPLTFAERGLTDGHFHLAVIGQPIGTLWIKVRAQPTTRFPPCRPDMAVSTLRATTASMSMRGATPRSHVSGALHLPPHFQMCKRAQCKTWRHCHPPSTPSRLTLALLTGRIYPFDFHRTGVQRKRVQRKTSRHNYPQSPPSRQTLPQLTGVSSTFKILVKNI